MDALLQGIVDSLASGILAVDLENRILFLNRSLARGLGVEREEWAGRPISVNLSPALDGAVSFWSPPVAG